MYKLGVSVLQKQEVRSSHNDRLHNACQQSILWSLSNHLLLKNSTALQCETTTLFKSVRLFPLTTNALEPIGFYPGVSGPKYMGRERSLKVRSACRETEIQSQGVSRQSMQKNSYFIVILGHSYNAYLRTILLYRYGHMNIGSNGNVLAKKLWKFYPIPVITNFV